jgi:exodeoxyribonuclease VII large subunit
MLPPSLSVGELGRHLSGVIRADELLQDIWVRGEVTSTVTSAQGHLYFTLKDPDAALDCVAWRSVVQRLTTRPRNGAALLAHGRVDLYAPRSRYQLVVDMLRPFGEGELFLQLEAVKAKLRGEGLFAEERKRPLPLFPRVVVAVTSQDGAAIHDIRRTLDDHPHPPQLVLVDARVQGDGAEASLCEALAQAARVPGVDVILFGRGGGSLLDLWCFNTEAVARAVAGSPVPVISAVGHETDFTLADLAADVRAATPTAGARLVLDRRDNACRRHDAAIDRARRLVRALIDGSRGRWSALAARPVLTRPDALLDARRQRLDDLARALEAGSARLRERRRSHLEQLAARLAAISPLATLGRGYASVRRRPAGPPVRSIAELQVGDELRVRLVDGAFDARTLALLPDGEV